MGCYWNSLTCHGFSVLLEGCAAELLDILNTFPLKHAVDVAVQVLCFLCKQGPAIVFLSQVSLQML